MFRPFPHAPRSSRRFAPRRTGRAAPLLAAFAAALLVAALWHPGENPAAQEPAPSEGEPPAAASQPESEGQAPEPQAPEPQTPEPQISETQPAEGPSLEAAQVRGPGPLTVHQTRLEATWDPEERLLIGRERLRWRNTASVPVDRLCFHHYLNAFSSNRSTFMQESGGEMRGDRFDDERWGWIETSSVQLAGGTDLKPVERYVAPDDGNPWDRTVAVYPLPEPVPPGAWITVEIDFESKMPAIFARTGAEGDYILAGQWYPKIAVYEDRGDRGREEPGWNCHQFHANSEFYADFGDYEVTLDLPARYEGKVGATGVKISETVSGDRVITRFVQRGVHDFAWTGDPEFLVFDPERDPRYRFDPARDVPRERQERLAEQLGVAPEELALEPVDLTLLVQPVHAAQADRYLEAAKAGIRGYGLRLGAYPYTTLTLVDPPSDARGSGGMEYPTFITLGTTALFSLPPFDEIRLPEVVTVHEFGHQYFQGLIASNEFEESWIDEGINSYYEMVVMSEEYPATIRFLGLELDSFEMSRARLGSGRFTDPIVLPSWRFLTRGSYGLNSYARTAVTLRHLENLLGPDIFHRAMRRFFQEHQFRHPTTADFKRAIQDSAGRDLDWFFDQALHSTRTLDYAVRSVESRRVPKERGVFWEDGERVERGTEDGDARGLGGLLDRFGGDTQDAGEEEEEEEEDDRPWESRVTVIRRGEFIHPVTVEMRFEDGGVLRRRWDGDRRWIRWTFTTDRELVSAEVDPDGLLALDVNRLNNSRTVERDPWPRNKLLGELLFWIQGLFAAGGLLA